MSDVHCSECGADRVIDPTGPWCGDPRCCSPVYMLDCGCANGDWCYCDEDHAGPPDLHARSNEHG
jgi:hypothetical protein